MRKVVITRIVLLSMISSFIACSIHSLYENTSDIPKGSWNRNYTVQFDIPVTDTINTYNIILSLRNNNSYPYSNIYIFGNTYYPNGLIVRDTIDFELCDSHGKWYGKGIGGIWQHQVYYSRNMSFPVSGNYRYTFTQAMRNENLEGILDIGIKVERDSKK